VSRTEINGRWEHVGVKKGEWVFQDQKKGNSMNRVFCGGKMVTDVVSQVGENQVKGLSYRLSLKGRHKKKRGWGKKAELKRGDEDMPTGGKVAKNRFMRKEFLETADVLERGEGV